MKSRRSIRLQEYDYSQPGAYFVTICVNDRENLLGNVVGEEMKMNRFGSVVEQYWNDLPNHYHAIELDTFVVMPNHIHGIIVILENPYVAAIHESPLPIKRRKMLLSKIIGRFKMNSAKRINEMRGTSGTPVWQRNYFEHIIRDEKSMKRIREYIANNPRNWTLDTENDNHIGNDAFDEWLRSLKAK